MTATNGYIKVTEGSGKRIANFAVQQWVDPGDGTAPALQTMYFQAVNVSELDENGNVLTRDDAIDYEWKKQLLDEMRAIRIGIEYLLETGNPSYSPAIMSLLEESKAQRLETNPPIPSIEQE